MEKLEWEDVTCLTLRKQGWNGGEKCRWRKESLAHPVWFDSNLFIAVNGFSSRTQPKKLKSFSSYRLSARDCLIIQSTDFPWFKLLWSDSEVIFSINFRIGSRLTQMLNSWFNSHFRNLCKYKALFTLIKAQHALQPQSNPTDGTNL